ncbi:hypothetical protein PEBR_00300 [Penicillium brasilianum]|uniref:AB hydrolase-1 domain-containing protein n=1 Tax=Penicillium brasilianum TaxID=104259 RepID=A0A1S9S0K5_PENBI|nr:hypothetical protein PEBR_00300 [Penicillium brasilianum]
MSNPLLTRTWVVPATHPRAPSTVQSPEMYLFIAVNEYRPSRVTSGATLLLTHGTSFCKELWEPLIEYWLRDDSFLNIQAVFAMDAVNHGDSAVLNQGRLGSSKMKRALQSQTAKDLQTGHRTNESVIPMETFATRDIDTTSPDSARTLKTTKEQESATYLAGPHPEIIDLLSKSREPHYYVMGGKSSVLNKHCRAVVQDLAHFHGDVTVVDDGGHLLPMTHPAELGTVLEQFLTKILSSTAHTRATL